MPSLPADAVEVAESLSVASPGDRALRPSASDLSTAAGEELRESADGEANCFTCHEQLS